MIHAWLLYSNRDMNSQSGYTFANDIEKDFNMEIIFKTMARDNPNIKMAVRKVMLTPLRTKEEVYYRQDILQDIIRNYEMFEELYQSIETMCGYMDGQSGGKSESPTSQMIQNLHLFQGQIDVMIEIQNRLRDIESTITSDGMKAFLSRLNGVDWQELKQRVKDMNFLLPGGSLTLNMSLGKGLKMDHIVIADCKGGDKNRDSQAVKGIKKMIHKVTGQNVVYLETEALVKSNDELKNAVMQHLLSHYADLIDELKYFFKNMRLELGFYLGANQLFQRFTQLEIPFSMPAVCEGEKTLYFQSLYELTLAIYTRTTPVPNDMAQVNKKLFVITGANQGGKSTFLRSVGIAQVMMQCGMFVPAKAYSNRLYDNILTHFTRKEDQQLNSGRLDEELHRMSQMIECVTPDSMMLLNESFASTTEKEGSVIAEDIVSALYELGTDVFMVTHLFEFARKEFQKKLPAAVYLTAERKEDGTRTFKMIEHQPNHTSYGLDLYDSIIGS